MIYKYYTKMVAFGTKMMNGQEEMRDTGLLFLVATQIRKPYRSGISIQIN